MHAKWGKGVPDNSTDANHLQCRRLRFHSWVGKIPWRRDRLPTPVFMGFPGGSAGKESARNAGDLGSIPGWGRFPCGGHSNPLQYSCLENPIDGGTWRATGHGVAESHTTKRLSTAQLGLIIKNKKETTKNPTATPEEPGAKAGHCTCNLH